MYAFFPSSVYQTPISDLSGTGLRDPKDKIVLETAWSVPVEVIVSGDEDLLVLVEFQKIPILTSQQFGANYQFWLNQEK